MRSDALYDSIDMVIRNEVMVGWLPVYQLIALISRYRIHYLILVQEMQMFNSVLFKIAFDFMFFVYRCKTSDQAWNLLSVKGNQALNLLCSDWNNRKLLLSSLATENCVFENCKIVASYVYCFWRGRLSLKVECKAWWNNLFQRLKAERGVTR